jgi:hypothetical protein
MKYIKTVFLLAIALFFKVLTYYCLLFKIKKISPTVNPHLIVSLTSYGRRVHKCVQYAVMSVLMQKNVIIDKIVLSLDKNNWNQDNLPWAIKRLSQLGVEIMYVEDTKSYKKLLPALFAYPDSVIITIDDDIYYSNNLIKELYQAHKYNPHTIISSKAKSPYIVDDKIIPYKNWGIVKYTDNYSGISPIGYGGVLYPPGALNKEVFNYPVFSKLAPTADDLWFWIMSLLEGTKHIVINDSKITLYPTDLIYQCFHKNSALAHDNVINNKNDVQLKSLIDHYKITLN